MTNAKVNVKFAVSSSKTFFWICLLLGLALQLQESSVCRKKLWLWTGQTSFLRYLNTFLCRDSTSDNERKLHKKCTKLLSAICPQIPEIEEVCHILNLISYIENVTLYSTFRAKVSPEECFPLPYSWRTFLCIFEDS